MQTTSENRNPTPIVAIGTSAWGLEALQEFFSQDAQALLEPRREVARLHRDQAELAQADAEVALGLRGPLHDVAIALRSSLSEHGCVPGTRPVGGSGGMVLGRKRDVEHFDIDRDLLSLRDDTIHG